MKLTEIITPDAIVPRLNATDREDAIAELIDTLVASGQAPQSSREPVSRAMQCAGPKRRANAACS